jgi:hypothetical protein
MAVVTTDQLTKCRYFRWCLTGLRVPQARIIGLKKFQVSALG